MNVSRTFVLAAGGTGGHMVPAHALAAELIARGHKVALVTDARGAKIPALFAGVPVHVMPAGRPTGGPLGWLKALAGIQAGRRMARALYREIGPTAVVGFGGYPALPALLAALGAGIPTVVHEQNAVLGRVNRLLAGRVKAIATAYRQVERLKPAYGGKVALVGNPVREAVKAIGREPFPAPADGAPIRVLVTGGSQGATILSTVVPGGLALLPDALKRRIAVVQQCRPEDLDGVRAAYAASGIAAELMSYITDMPAVLAASHLVIARAGASTIAELTVAGRPAILVPLPSAMDDHQSVNAREMADQGGAVAIAQAAFTPATLAREVGALLGDGETLIVAAARAKACGRPNATEDLADLVESFGRPPVMDAIGDNVRGRRSVRPAVAMGKMQRQSSPGGGGGPLAKRVVEGYSTSMAAHPSSAEYPSTSLRLVPLPLQGRI